MQLSLLTLNRKVRNVCIHFHECCLNTHPHETRTWPNRQASPTDITRYLLGRIRPDPNNVQLRLGSGTIGGRCCISGSRQRCHNHVRLRDGGTIVHNDSASIGREQRKEVDGTPAQSENTACRSKKEVKECGKCSVLFSGSWVDFRKSG